MEKKRGKGKKRNAPYQNAANQSAAYIFLRILAPEMPSNHFAPFIWPDDSVFGRYQFL